jgi:hypothetical protein
VLILGTVVLRGVEKKAYRSNMPAIDTIAAIAEQYGVVIHPPAGLGTKGAPAPAGD